MKDFKSKFWSAIGWKTGLFVFEILCYIISRVFKTQDHD